MWFYKQGCTYNADVRESEQTERGTGWRGGGGGRILIFRAILWRLTRPVTRRRTKWAPTNKSSEGGPCGEGRRSGGPANHERSLPSKDRSHPFSTPPAHGSTETIHRCSSLSHPLLVKTRNRSPAPFLRAAGLPVVPSSDASSAQRATDGRGESSGP